MFDETERDIVVGLVGRTAEFSGVTVVAYCVMSNHLHLFLFIDKPESLQLFERWADIVGVDLERARDGESYRLQDGTILCEDEAEEVRSCVAMSLFDRYEMIFDELKRRMQLLMRPSAYQELMDKWSSMPKADLDLECARFLRRMYDLSGFMKTLKQDSHQHHFEKRAVFVGRGVMAVGTNESNTYWRTERKNTVFRSANQYSRTQPITCRKRRFLKCRGAVGRLENGFSAIHTDTNVGIIGDNVCEMTDFSEWQSILTNIGIQANTTE